MRGALNTLIAEQSALDAFLAGLPPALWEAKTPYTGWTVRDTLAHIAFFDEAAKKLVTGEAASFDGLLAEVTLDELSRVTEYRQMEATPLLSWWRQARNELCAALYHKDPKARVPWASGLNMSARSLASARMMELWAHTVDVYDALDLPLPDATDDAIDSTLFLSWQARPNQYRINGLELPETPVFLELTLPSGGSWTRGDPEAADRIRGDAVAWCLVAIRRRNWMDTELAVTGSEARRYAEIVQTYAGVADPPPARQRRSTEEDAT